MRSIAIILLLIGITFIIIGYTNMQIKCPPPKIEYRFVPRSFIDEQLSNDSINTVKSIFNQEDPFLKINRDETEEDTSKNFFT